MYAIKELQQLIDDRIERLHYDREPKALYDPIYYILQLGGKRVRPALLLATTDMMGARVERAVEQAVAIEVFHNFTLMHDDIMDDAPLRRGEKTVHEKWDIDTAILSGDAMLILAYKHLLQTEERYVKPVLETFSEAALQICEGQEYDLQFEGRNNVMVDGYLKMIRLKTAALLGAAMKIGAIIGGAKEEEVDKVYKFAEHLGMAFQLQDDILDVYGDPKTFGKQVGGDIIENKKTYLLLKALELSSGGQLQHIKKWLAIDDRPEEKVRMITAVYNELEVRELAERARDKYYYDGLDYLRQMQVHEARKQPLYNFAKQLLNRKS